MRCALSSRFCCALPANWWMTKYSHTQRVRKEKDACGALHDALSNEASMRDASRSNGSSDVRYPGSGSCCFWKIGSASAPNTASRFKPTPRRSE